MVSEKGLVLLRLALNVSSDFLFTSCACSKENSSALCSACAEPSGRVRIITNKQSRNNPALFICRRRDLNPHRFLHTHLKRTCLPFHHSDIKIMYSFYTIHDTSKVVDALCALSQNVTFSHLLFGRVPLRHNYILINLCHFVKLFLYYICIW